MADQKNRTRPTMALKCSTRSKTGSAEIDGDVLNRENAWGQFTDEFVQANLFPFLSINDISNLSMTSRENHQMVSSLRSYPCIIWEARCPTKMGYGRIDEENDDCIVVMQLQTFRFLFRTNESGEYVQVEFTLQNEVWDEHLNMRDGGDCRGLHAFPSDTKPSIAIIKPRKNNQMRKRLFVVRQLVWGEDGFLGEDEEAGGYRDYIEHDQDWTPGDKADLEIAMGYNWICAKRIATYQDGTVYPSAEYLMRAFPEWLYTYFPSNFDWDAEHEDRSTRVEFSYRPAHTLAEWREEVPLMYDGIYDYELDELPWYRDGYS
jgi:hypothetical protein